MNNTNEQSASLRFGHVTEYDPSLHAARVSVPDRGTVSHWLPILTTNTLRNHDEVHLDPGEHVAYLMAGNGSEMGVILGAFFDRKNTPPVHDQDKRAHTFDDGTQVIYDRASHTITVKAENITLEGGKILFSGGTISLDGSVECPGYCRC